MKKYGILLTILVLCLSMTACNSLDYKKATEQFNAKSYEAALPMYTALGDYEDSVDKAKECRYQIGLSALESKEWDKAISSFENSDYKDSAKNLEFCQREKGMHEKADYAFLEAIVESIKSRSALLDSNSDYGSLVQGELAILSDFSNAEFYDSTLKKLAKDYIAGVNKQKEALKLKYSEYQIKWLEGAVERYDVLETLYEDYGVFKDDTDFKRDYLLPLEDTRAELTALKIIENDLYNQLEGMNFQYVNTYTCSAPYCNNTRYDFDAQFYFTFYDQNGIRIDDSFNVIPNIKSQENCQLQFSCPSYWNTCEFFWEIFPHV